LEELMLVENPYGMYNPRRRHSKKSRKGGFMKRNPIKGAAKEWFQGISMVDAGAALGGLAVATMLPGMIIKVADGATITTNQKVMKIAVAAVGTVATGFVFRNVSPNAGKMAIAGGLAGTLSQVLGSFTPWKIGQQARIAAPQRFGRIAESRSYSNVEDSGVQVSVT
jgi:hypothetical protein